ncbi:MAG: GTPase domain-containing protein [Okeania sp. SIO3B5]|uniref:GTPase family protein n=1 Tax=Okeania sp. SIO3B5 TaxID=2607811 RepID=UPI001400C013|nr:GTPase domain-containing protein [Okeania sp. SIO3B5]NEO55561.1 GTPase domain-containing protein [Okeania sp. SIO3B5]
MIEQENEIKKVLDNLSAPNIAVIGLTGVGKSSLINKIFGNNIATTGAGRAITTEYTKYSPSAFDIDLPVSLYDSPGYEPGIEQGAFVKKTIDFLKYKNRQGKEEQIHILWYLINASTARLTQADIDIIEKINHNHIPAIIVLSKCDIAQPAEKEQVKKAIEETMFSKVYKIVEVAASPLTLPNGEYICEPFGMKELVNLTSELLPKTYSDALIVAQIVDIESKRKLAWKYIREASIACFGVGAIPIPLSSPTGAIGALGYMYNRIIVAYGHTNRALLLAISGITLGGVRTVVTNALLDVFSLTFPGISALTGGTAAVFTAASGIAFTKTCERLAIEKLSDSEGEIKQKIREIFQEEFRNSSSLQVSKPNDLDRVGTDFINHKI